MKILLAVDGSAYSDAAVEEIAKRPWPLQSEVKVITAAEMPVMVGVEPWAASPEYFEIVEKSVRETANSFIESALLKLKTIEGKTLRISSEIIQGSPRQVIVDEAETWNADLIVVGSRNPKTRTFTDAGQVLNTGGIDPGACSGANEGHDWVRIHGHD